MKKTFAFLSIFFICLLLTFVSCADDSDLEETPVNATFVSKPLMNSRLDASHLYKEIIVEEQYRVISDTLNLKDGTSEFLMDHHLKSVNLHFKFLNSFASDFKVDFEFLNEANDVKYKIHVPISSGTLEEPTQVETFVYVEEPEIESLKGASKMVYHLKVQQGDKLMNPTSPGTLELQSEAIFSFAN